MEAWAALMFKLIPARGGGVARQCERGAGDCATLRASSPDWFKGGRGWMEALAAPMF
jgi:hypothetical protein